MLLRTPSSVLRLALLGLSFASFTACSDDSSSTSTETAGAAGTDTGGAAGDTGTPTAGTGAAGMGAAGMGAAGMGAAGMGAAGMGAAGMGAAGMGAAGEGGDTAGAAGADSGEDMLIYIADFDTAAGFVADRGEDAEGWATDGSATLITPMRADGIASFTIPFTGADQNFGWNFNLDGAPVDTTGMELVVRVRATGPFPGGVQLFTWSNEWAGDTNSWTNVGPEGEWFEAVLDLDAADPDTGDGEPDFDKTQANAVGVTFHTGSEGADATTTTFEVDYVALRLKEGGMVDNGEAGASSMGDGGMDPVLADLELVTDFDELVGSAAGGSEPPEWSDAEGDGLLSPTVADGVASFEIPFTDANQQFGWVVPVESPPMDATGMELVVQVQVVTEGYAGGIQTYAFSDDWAASLNEWHNAPPAGSWMELTMDLDQMDESFDPSLLNAVGVTFNTGDGGADSVTTTFLVDYIGLRAKEAPTGEDMGDSGVAGGMTVEMDAGTDAGMSEMGGASAL